MNNSITEKYTFRQIRPFLLLIFGIALVARLLYLRESVETPYFAIPYLDELYHYQWAKKIAEGQLLSEHVFFRAPLYAYLLGAKFFLLGDDFLTTKLLQHFVGAITAVLIFVMSFLLFGGGFILSKNNSTTMAISANQQEIKPSPALISASISAIIYALYAPVIFFEGELLDIFLSLFFYPLIIYTLLYGKQCGWRSSNIFLTGLMVGLAAISRPNVLVFIPFIILYIFYHLYQNNSKGAIFRLSLILLLGIVLPILPVTLHNAIVGHCFVPISSYGGINFYIGNTSTADGFTPKTTRQYVVTGEYQDSVELFARKEAALLLGYEPRATEINAYWRYRVWQEIAESPKRFVLLMWKKNILFWNAYEIKNNKSLYVVTEFTPLLRSIWFVFNFGTVIPLALAGLIMALIFERKYRVDILFVSLLALSFCFSVILFFVSFRHRLPVVTLLIPFAGYGLFFLLTAIHQLQWHRLFTFIVFLVPLALVINKDWFGVRRNYNPAQDYWSVANCLQEKNQLEQTVQYYQKALAYDDRLTDAYNNLGRTLFLLNRYDEAVKNFQRAIELDPKYVKAYNNLGVYYEEIGDDAQARQFYEKAILMEPEYALAHLNLARVLYKSGDLNRACYHYQWAKKLGITTTLDYLEEINEFISSR